MSSISSSSAGEKDGERGGARGPSGGVKVSFDPTEERREVAEELAREVARLAAEGERRRRVGVGHLQVAACAALLAVAPLLPGLPSALGSFTERQCLAVVLPALAVFELAAMAFVVAGAESPLYRLLSALDELGQIAAPLVLVFLSGSASSLLSFVGMVRAYGWTPTTSAHQKRTVAFFAASHVALIAAFLLTHRPADASVLVLILLGSAPIHQMAQRVSARNLAVRAERAVLERELQAATVRHDRERIARELHDGVGADVMTLVLRLRRAAEEETNPNAARLSERATHILAELRTAVRSLRDERGTRAH